MEMRKRYFVVVAAALLLGGCQPKPNAGDLVKNMVVTTDYDNTVDFTKYGTYYLPLDTISYFNNSDPVAADTLQCNGCSGNNGILGIYANIITSELRNQLNQTGFSKVEKKQSPDLRIYVFIVENVNVYQSYNYNPYGYGYGYGDNSDDYAQ